MSCKSRLARNRRSKRIQQLKRLKKGEQGVRVKANKSKQREKQTLGKAINPTAASLKSSKKWLAE